MRHEMILILDFGSQYTQLIARTLRSLHVYCEIHPFNISAKQIQSLAPKAIIFSGSPSSLLAPDSPRPDSLIWELGLPILGICYGQHLIAEHFGGKIESHTSREYGRALLELALPHPLFADFPSGAQVWMSHGDSVSQLPAGFQTLASTTTVPNAAIAHSSQPIFALQFHPEVVHTAEGKQILANFALRLAGCKADWTPENFITSSIQAIRERTGSAKVVLGLSGGVDSSVAALLLHKAIGDRLIPIFVDNGCMRWQEAQRVREAFYDVPGIKIDFVDASHSFWSASPVSRIPSKNAGSLATPSSKSSKAKQPNTMAWSFWPRAPYIRT